MPSAARKREEARQLFLAGEAQTNAEIAARVHVKPHTVGRWRKEEDWEGLKRKIDRRAAELFVERIANERVTLNVRHYRVWELVLADLLEHLKSKRTRDIREIERISGVVERAQKGQRLAKGLALTGETEEAIRAEGVAHARRLIDAFIDATKEIPDETTRERIRRAILERLPPEEAQRAGEPADPLPE